MKRSLIISGLCLSVIFSSCVSMKQYKIVEENNKTLNSQLEKSDSYCNQKVENAISANQQFYQQKIDSIVLENKMLKTEKESVNSSLQSENLRLRNEKQHQESLYNQLTDKYNDLLKKQKEGANNGANNKLVQYVDAVYSYLNDNSPYSTVKSYRNYVNIQELSVEEKNIFNMANAAAAFKFNRE